MGTRNHNPCPKKSNILHSFNNHPGKSIIIHNRKVCHQLLRQKQHKVPIMHLWIALRTYSLGWLVNILWSAVTLGTKPTVSLAKCDKRTWLKWSGSSHIGQCEHCNNHSNKQNPMLLQSQFQEILSKTLNPKTLEQIRSSECKRDVM